MIYSDRKDGSLQIGTQKRYSTYNCHAYLVQRAQFLLLVVQSTRPAVDMVVAFVFLFPMDYSLDLHVANIGIECVLSFTSQ